MVDIDFAKGIMMNDEMVRAVLRGDKTVTRRLADVHAPMVRSIGNSYYLAFPDEHYEDGYRLGHEIKQAYKPGDRLYVREAWRVESVYDPEKEGRGKYNRRMVRFKYRADGYVNTVYVPYEKYDRYASIAGESRWHPSIHMPKEASRAVLDVKNVSLKHLQDMTDEDAVREGAAGLEDFARIWDSTVDPGRRKFDGWNADPWVFVYEFELC